MTEIGGMQLSGLLRPADYDDIRSVAATAECSIIDASPVETFSTQLIDVVRKAIETSPAGRLRVAIVGNLSAWALFGGRQNTGVPELRLFHGAQLESFEVQRWIREGGDPDPEIERVLLDLEGWLDSEWAAAIVDGVARQIRRAPNAEAERYIARLLSVAHGYVPEANLQRIAQVSSGHDPGRSPGA